MSKLNKIEELSDSVVENFINSVDVVLFDIDGVLVHNKTPIPGAIDFLDKIRKLQKTVLFATNNTVYPKNIIVENLRPFRATEEEIITPNDVLLNYLDVIKFKKDIYTITTSVPKKLLRESGYNVITYEQIQPTPVEESISGIKELVLRGLEACKNVGLVYLDYDPNMGAGNIQLANAILNYSKQKEDIILLSGLCDDVIPTGGDLTALGPQYYIDAMERWTQRKAQTTAKPGIAMADFIKSKYNIKEKVLMIGDNVSTDIAFGVNAGFKTLLVLSGCTTEQEVMPTWSYSGSVKPDYVSPSLAEVYQKIKNM